MLYVTIYVCSVVDGQMYIFRYTPLTELTCLCRRFSFWQVSQFQTLYLIDYSDIYKSKIVDSKTVRISVYILSEI